MATDPNKSANDFLDQSEIDKLLAQSASGVDAGPAKRTLIRPDGGYIGRDRRLYVTVKKPLRDGRYGIYALPLPNRLAGIDLGSAVTGAASYRAPATIR